MSSALTDGRPWSSLLVDGRILLEIPPTAVPELRRRRIALEQLDCVLISHFHADHVFGIPFLLLEYRIRSRRTAPILLVGPPGLQEFVETLCHVAWRGICADGPEPSGLATYVEVEAGKEIEVGEARVVAFPMAHYGLRAFGYRIAYRGRSIAYSGDTGPCPELEALLEGADAAILEYTHAGPKDDPGHLDTTAIERLARPLASRGVRILATHMSGKPRPVLGVTLCKPGRTYRI